MRSLVVSAAIAGLVLVPAGAFAAAGSASAGVPAAVSARAKETKPGKGTAPKKETAPKQEAPSKGTAPAKGVKAKSAKPAKPLTVVYAGRLRAVDATAGTITFVVKGGADKALRNKPLTLAVPSAAKVTRNDGAATLAQLLVGDHVNVKTSQVGGVVTVIRVSASGITVTPAPAEPTPTPTETTPTETTPTPSESTPATSEPTSTA